MSLVELPIGVNPFAYLPGLPTLEQHRLACRRDAVNLHRRRKFDHVGWDQQLGTLHLAQPTVDVQANRIFDYFLIPAGAMPAPIVWMGTEGGSALEPHRCPTLNGLELLVGLPRLAEDEVEGADD